jgi:hypothetical protein
MLVPRTARSVPLALVVVLALGAAAPATSSRAAPRPRHDRVVTSTVLDDRALVRAGRWRSISNARAYLHTLSKSRKRGATLTSPVQTVAGGSVRLQFGPRRGKVQVWVGGAKVTTIRTALASRRFRTVDFSGSGPVVLRVARPRRGVYVDKLSLNPPRVPSVGDVVITEFMADPTGPDATQDWIELTNVAGDRLSLGGCAVGHNQPDSSALPANLTISPHGIVLVARSADRAVNGGLPNVDALFSFNLLDTAYVTLTCGGVLVDRTATLPGANTHFPGRAMQLKIDAPTTATANDVVANWCDAQATYGAAGNWGTPGRSNTTCF